jgi:N-acetylneuraminate synthase
MKKVAVKIGKKMVGDGYPTYIIAEIGINHNGSLEITRQLIDAAVDCGCSAVKFQKRTVEAVYTAEELAKPRENPFGPTYGDSKRSLEFGYEQYKEIDNYCRIKNIDWFASCWDEGSVDFIEQFNPPCYKIASVSLTDEKLLKHHRKYNRPIILSTGMADMDLIDRAVNILGKHNLVILHCTSTYPSKPEELNLNGILTLKEQYPDVPIGYSGHEVGLVTTATAVALGAVMVERHITLDRSMWGSDQSASVEPQGFKKLVRDIRNIELAMGDGVIRIYESEKPIIAKLRRV